MVMLFAVDKLLCFSHCRGASAHNIASCLPQSLGESQLDRRRYELTSAPSLLTPLLLLHVPSLLLLPPAAAAAAAACVAVTRSTRSMVAASTSS
jgi:hypothetical protein